MAMSVYHFTESQKSSNEQIKIESNDDGFFSIFMGLCTFTEFLKVKLLNNITTFTFLLNFVKE